MSKIVVFGATGGTGRQVVEQALAGGHQVTAVVRNTDAFTLQHEHLHVINGNVLQANSFENNMGSHDVVISCLGIQKQEPTTVYSEGVRNIVRAMSKNNISRIICISAGAVIIPPKSSFLLRFVTKNILKQLFKHSYADMLRMEKELSESDTNWTVIRAPWLRNSERTEKYRFAINEHLRNLSKISRADLADFILNHLTDEKTYKAIIEVSY